MSESSVKPNQEQTEVKPWQATPRHWDELRQWRYARGWQLAALSLGFAPIPKVKDLLPDDDAKENLLHRRKVINKCSRSTKGQNFLQFEEDWPPNESGIERKYDVVKYANFLQSLIKTETFSGVIHGELVRIAKEFHAKDLSDENAAKNRDSKQAKGGATKVENSTQEVLLGLAIFHYDYMPDEVESENKKYMEHVFKDISEHLKNVAIPVSSDMIRDRVRDACRRLADAEKLHPVVDAAKAFLDAKRSKLGR